MQEHVGLITKNQMFERTDAMRWLARTLHHVERIAHYHQDTLPAEPGAAKDGT